MILLEHGDDLPVLRLASRPRRGYPGVDRLARVRFQVADQAGHPLFGGVCLRHCDVSEELSQFTTLTRNTIITGLSGKKKYCAFSDSWSRAERARHKIGENLGRLSRTATRGIQAESPDFVPGPFWPEGYGEDREAEGCGPRAGRSERSDVHGLELRREEAVIQGDVIGCHVVPKLTGGWLWSQSRASKQAAPQGREPCSPGDSGSFARSRIQKESRFRRAAAFSIVRTSIGFHP